jgi:hypothetical protein
MKLNLYTMTRLKLAFLGLLLTLTAAGQHKNVEIGTISDGEKHSVPAVVISRKDARIIVVKGAGKTFYLSSDSGASWETVAVDGMDSAEWMTILSDSKGGLHAVYALPGEGNFRVVVSQSKDNGKTWSAAVTVSPVGGDQKYPSASFDVKGNLFVAWTESAPGADGKCESAIMMSTSSNGSKWSKPMRVSQAGGSCEETNEFVTGGVPAIGPDGKAFVSWVNNGKIYLDRSFGSNMWLENDIVVNTITPGWKLNVPGYNFVASPPQLFIDQTKGSYHGCIYFAWSDQKSGEGDTDVWFIRSNNYGDNWSTPTKLGTSAAQTEQYAPRMTVDQSTGYVYVLFYDRGEHDDGRTDVVLAYSAESGGSFKTTTVSDSSFVADDKSGAGVYLDIAAHGGVIVPVWTRTVDGKTSIWTTTIRQEELIKPVVQTAKPKKKK